MNIEKLEKLAAVIERTPHSRGYEEGTKNRFNMFMARFPCGSPACLAGWAVELFRPGYGPRNSFIPFHNISEIARQELGLTEDQASALFTPYVKDMAWEDITPQQAAAAIRRLIAREPLNTLFE